MVIEVIAGVLILCYIIFVMWSISTDKRFKVALPKGYYKPGARLLSDRGVLIEIMSYPKKVERHPFLYYVYLVKVLEKEF